ncbi:MAG: hypothetical protein ACRBFS_25125 [Aureispira sp.]
MSCLSALGQGFTQAWRYKRAIFVCYLLVAAWAFLLAYPLHYLLETTVGHSLLVEEMIKGFDYTLLNDFKNAYGTGFTPILEQSVLVVGLSMLSLIFATGGILALVTEQPKQYAPAFFWGKSVVFFWRLVRLSFYFLLIHSLVLGLFLFLFYTTSNGLSPFSLENEATIAFNFKWIAPLYILVAAFFFLWQDYTKLFLVAGDKKWIFQALWPAFFFIIKDWKAYVLYLLNGVLWLLLILGNYYLYKAVTVNNFTTILLSLCISQLFILSRFTLKVTMLGSLQTWKERRLANA